MNILILLVIAMFIIVGVYVGYHASQQAGEEIEEHDVTIELEILNENSRLVQIYQNPELKMKSL
ncbi:MAG: hypothetical protein OPY06_04720 [Nitrosopumilus sp.]|nr:hypothetical protein [Nitrosopumilus sp.]MDF2423137.1 hypothetical protein [Nitrosopumilus sp.]MDF2424149.1 hypothetical protein [Nitrosopumilus sp.]MDF2425978.1 hypothetical protein [Nitrosopumilus sp.]MDF2427552.1 hypothetical protein [Nitrosopumilus sp.]